MSTKKIPFWIGSGGDAIYCCLHIPHGAGIRSTGILICNASGHEYTHSHLAIRHLAQELAGEGYPVLRFDYNGSGDSPGSAFSKNLISSWLNNIEQAIITLKQNTGCTSICLCGLRMGATLAALYTQKQSIDYLILWNPCINGKAYVRDMQVLSEYKQSQENNQGLIDSGGFIITAETAEDYSKINLNNTNFQVSNRALLLNRDDVPHSKRLPEHIKSLGITLDEAQTPGYAQMMQQPQFSVSPNATIRQIAQWLKQSTPSDNVLPNSIAGKSFLKKIKSESFQENICEFGKDQNLLGILCKPLSDINTDLPLVLISNTGAAHHVGPNRLHVEFCRALANAGYASLRFDLANLGDSVNGKPRNENHPYPEHAGQDMLAALSFISNRHGVTKVVPAGLCSGANAAFHCALNNEDFDIPEAILINPLIFYWQEGLSLATPESVNQASDKKYYTRSMKDPKKWLKLLKGQTKLSNIVKFAYTQMTNKIKAPLLNLSELFGLKEPSKLSKGLLKYSRFKRHLSLFISENDPGYHILMSEAKRVAKKKIRQSEIDVYFIKDADHTFIAKRHRDRLIDCVIEHLDKRYKSG